MTPDLAELRRLADEATEAPWQVESCGCCVYTEPGQMVAGADADSDTRFIAAARSAVPALCEEVDRLRGLLDRCERALADLGVMWHKPTNDNTACVDCGRVWQCPEGRASALLAELRAEPDETKP